MTSFAANTIKSLINFAKILAVAQLILPTTSLPNIGEYKMTEFIIISLLLSPCAVFMAVNYFSKN